MVIAGVPRTNVAVDVTRKIERYWDQWLQTIVNAVNRAAQVIGSPVALETQHASIGATSYTTLTLAAGLYRLTYSERVTRAASSSSSLTFTAGWTFNGQACSQAGAAMTDNVLTAQQNGSVLMAVDAGTAITYAVDYATTGGTTMQYALNVLVELMPS